MCQVPCRNLKLFITFPPKFHQIVLLNVGTTNAPSFKRLGSKASVNKKSQLTYALKASKVYLAKKVVDIPKFLQKVPLSDSIRNIEITRKRVTLAASLALGLSLLIFSVKELGRPYLGLDGRPKLDRFSNLPLLAQYTVRALYELKYYITILTSSSSGKLLPDQIFTNAELPKYTLVLELTGVLVHPDWSREKGWGFKKRPGIDFFLDTVGKNYEIVVYTAEPAITVFPIVKAMDPKNIISYKLVRNATLFIDGHHIKDLENINRKLNRVVVVDWDCNCTKYHPENVLAIPRWNGNDDDMSLIYLTQFLQAIADNGIEDVREVLKYYNKFDDPLKVFREKQTKLVEIAEANADKHRCSEGKNKNIIFEPPA